MAATYEPIATQTLSTSTATVSFTSISGTYTDLILIVNLAQAASNNSLRFRVNSDTGSNYSYTSLQGDGSVATSSRESSITSGASSATGSTTIETNHILHFMNYSNTTTNKTILARGNRASAMTTTDVNLWRSTSAITSIELAMGGTFPTNNFASGSTFTLYGIKAA